MFLVHHGWNVRGPDEDDERSDIGDFEADPWSSYSTAGDDVHD